jgi:uncharacterized protein YbjT (DUF2867 family)
MQHIISRRLRCAASLHHNVEVAAGDLDDPRSLGTALEAVSGVFLLPGYTDMPGLLSSFIEAGIARVALLSGSSAGSGDENNAISRYMIRSERAVRASGIAWTIIRPSAFMSNTCAGLRRSPSAMSSRHRGQR